MRHVIRKSTMLMVVLLGLAGCTDREEAARQKVEEANAIMAAVPESASYSEKLAAFDQAYALMADVVKRFGNTPTGKALQEGKNVDGINYRELERQIGIIRPRAAKENHAGAGLMGFEQESAVVKSFFVEGGECIDNPQTVECLGYATQVAAKVVGIGKDTQAVVVDLKQTGDAQPLQQFLGGFLPLYKIERAKFDALIQSISQGLESSFVQGGIKVSGVATANEPQRVVYRMVLRSALHEDKPLEEVKPE